MTEYIRSHAWVATWTATLALLVTLYVAATQ